jgi:hypothetical protein
MKLRHKTKYFLKKRLVKKGSDGERYATYSDEYTEIKATVYSGSGQMVSGQAGYVQQYQKKLLIDEPYEITNENGIETYWFRDRTYNMAAGDGICIYVSQEQNPDYRIIGIYPVGHLKILLEKI